jgi:hypothetical protein
LVLLTAARATNLCSRRAERNDQFVAMLPRGRDGAQRGSALCMRYRSAWHRRDRGTDSILA